MADRCYGGKRVGILDVHVWRLFILLQYVLDNRFLHMLYPVQWESKRVLQYCKRRRVQVRVEESSKQRVNAIATMTT